MNLQYKAKFNRNGASFGVENINGKNTLVAYFIPEGSGYIIISDVDISKMDLHTIPTSKTILGAADKFLKNYRGGID
ncbi:hypothetical protein HYZ41_02540 [archaeon]|nr:hypothetical protein [archaeon]